MRFGHFDDAAREYVIETPRTPYPWINYLGTEEFFGLVSHTGGGYCFYRDARLRRLTRYRYNNVPTDVGGRYYYVNDGGDYWTPGWAPVKRELDFYECRVGLSYTKITGRRKGLETEVLYFVPLGTNAEVHRVTLTNRSKKKKSVKLFSFVEFCLWNASDDQTNYQRNLSIGEVEVEGSTIYHKTEYRERRNHYAFYTVNAKVKGFDTDRESFLGLYERLRRAAGGGGRQVAQLDGERVVADRLAPARGRPRARRVEDVRVRARVRREPGRGEVGEAGRRQQEEGRGDDRPLREDGAGRRGSRRAARLLDAHALDLQREVEGRPARPDGQHLEPVPVHGHVQHVALGLVLRDRHRPRHGLPRLEPGPPRLRPPRPLAREGAHPRHRGDAEGRRERLPPVPAAHEAREQRHRRGLQRRPAVARLGNGRLRQGVGRLRHPEGDGAVRQRPEERGVALRAPQALVPPRARATSVRTACRSSAAPTGTTA